MPHAAPLLVVVISSCDVMQIGTSGAVADPSGLCALGLPLTRRLGTAEGVCGALAALAVAWPDAPGDGLPPAAPMLQAATMSEIMQTNTQTVCDVR